MYNILNIYFTYIIVRDKIQADRRLKMTIESLVQVLKFFHILTVIFMAAPLYALVIVNERALMGGAFSVKMDNFMENIIRRNALRCYVLQVTALVTGVGLVLAHGWGWRMMISNPALLLKLLLLFLLICLLSVVHFSIQPRIDALLSQVKEDPFPEDIAKQIRPLRLRRKKMSAFCLFVVLTINLLALQISGWFPLELNVILFAFAAVFSRRVFKSPVTYGWF